MVEYQNQVSVALVGKIIIARVQETPTLDILDARYERILQLYRDTGCTALLIDDRDMSEMPYEAVRTQQLLSLSLDMLRFRIAVLVANARMAYFARLQFGMANHQVFINDMSGAMGWLAPMSGRPVYA